MNEMVKGQKTNLLVYLSLVSSSICPLIDDNNYSNIKLTKWKKTKRVAKPI